MEKYKLVTDINKVERLISEINTIHKKYSEEYFESGKLAMLGADPAKTTTSSALTLERIASSSAN